MIRRPLLAALALATAAAPAAVSAATVAQTFSLADAGDLQLPAFNTALGKLNAVTFSFSAKTSYNWSATAGPEGEPLVDVLVDFNGDADLSTQDSLIQFFSLFDGDNVLEFLGQNGSASGTLGLSFSGNAVFTDPARMALFSNAASPVLFFYGFSGMESEFNVGLANYTGAFGPISGMASLTYDYTPVLNGIPEPGSWALMLAGFGLTGATLRQRRRLLA